MTSAQLAVEHEVEIVSVFRDRAEPHFAYDSRIRLRALADVRPDSPLGSSDDPRRLRPSRIFPAWRSGV